MHVSQAGALFGCLDWSEPRYLGVHDLGGGDEICEQAFVDVELTFIFRGIAKPVGLVEHPPDPGRDVNRMLQCLKDDIPLVRSVAVPAQSGKGKRVGSIVSKVKSA